jgi:hypothetical protein
VAGKSVRAVLCCVAWTAAAGCHYHRHVPIEVPPADARPVAPPPALPALTVEQVSNEDLWPAPGRANGNDPLAGLPPGESVTLSSNMVDVRALIAILAEAAGLSLVVDPEIEGQMSVNLVDVPARDALAIVLDQAGLSIVSGPPAQPWGPAIFYTVPIDIEEASVEMIQARFDVSRETAEFIVRSRVWPGRG